MGDRNKRDPNNLIEDPIHDDKAIGLTKRLTQSTENRQLPLSPRHNNTQFKRISKFN